MKNKAWKIPFVKLERRERKGTYIEEDDDMTRCSLDVNSLNECYSRNSPNKNKKLAELKYR